MSKLQLILQDDRAIWKQLLPLTYTKPISALRIGIDTIAEKWESLLNMTANVETEDYLQAKFGSTTSEEAKLIVNSSIIPTTALVKEIQSLSAQQSLEKNGVFIAQVIENNQFPKELVESNTEIIQLQRPWDLFLKNETIFLLDFERITKGRKSEAISATNRVKNKEQIFLEPGAKVEFSILNAEKAPIYIGKDATILEGCMIQGGLAMLSGAMLKMGTKHYGTSTLGPYCKVGGEINNVVFQGYSNKGHDGFLGNAAIGEWCNLGADTNASNLKNNYSPIRAWSYAENQQIDTQQQFLGLIMGDHAKCGINTMFNTATVVGVAANIFGSGFPKKHIPSFAWGGVDFIRTFTLGKSYEMAEAMMRRRDVAFTDEDKAIFNHIFEETKVFRNS